MTIQQHFDLSPDGEATPTTGDTVSQPNCSGHRSAGRKPRYSKEEFAHLGNKIYESHVRSQVETGNYGKIVAIDIETGAFEVADDSLTAAKQLLKNYPDAQIFGIRIGHLAVHRFGFRTPTTSV
jgi:hypothetical protein